MSSRFLRNGIVPWSFKFSARTRKMTSTLSHTPSTLGPLHPAKVQKAAIKPSVAKSIGIRVKDPLDHDAPAILHEPRNYNQQRANSSAVVLISGAGGGVSGPAGMVLLILYDELFVLKY
jgi:hypothetical protein